MAYFGSQTNAEFGAGIDHLTATGRGNDQSLTLGDQGLDATSARWAGLTPRHVLATTAGGSDDSSFERYQRDAGGYEPGSMAGFQDQLSGGSDDNAA